VAVVAWISMPVVHAAAHGGQEHAADEQHQVNDRAHGHGTHEEAGEAEGGQPLSTVGAVWHAIEVDVERLEVTIESKEWTSVHELAFAIRDLAVQLPAKSTDLPEAKRKLLAGYVERVKEHANNLDTFGDAGNAERTTQEFARLRERLGYMKKLYSPEMLSAAERAEVPYVACTGIPLFQRAC